MKQQTAENQSTPAEIHNAHPDIGRYLALAVLGSSPVKIIQHGNEHVVIMGKTAWPMHAFEVLLFFNLISKGPSGPGYERIAEKCYHFWHATSTWPQGLENFSLQEVREANRYEGHKIYAFFENVIKELEFEDALKLYYQNRKEEVVLSLYEEEQQKLNYA